MIKLFKGRSSFSSFISEHLMAYPQRMILLSFLLFIVIGTLVLMHPGMTVSDGSLNFLDALFTATSATCVTGLVTLNIAESFTIHGQVTILILIQLGGLGIMSYSTFFMFLFVGKLSLFGRDFLSETFSQSSFINLGKLVMVVFKFTILLECVGWGLMTIVFVQDYPLGEALYYGLFHSISAFCNSGFNILQNGYLPYASDWLFNLTNVVLIISGGLGFIVIFDISSQINLNRKLIFKRLSLHTRIVLISTAFLVLGGTLLIWLFESSHSLKGLPINEQILVSLFQSTSTRTAGFNTVELEKMSVVTLFIMIFLMGIGASPGSCGGGIKTTTFVLFFETLKKQFSNDHEVTIFERRIPLDTRLRSFSIVFFAIFVIILFSLLLLVSELHIAKSPFTPMQIFFESVSAFGTVGLSMGITEMLSNYGKYLIIMLMFIGRLGPLTLVFALKSHKESSLKYMKEDIMVG